MQLFTDPYITFTLKVKVKFYYLTPPATAERSVAAALRIWFTPGRAGFFFSAIFSESSEPIGLKFDHNAWIGPEVTV